MDLLKISLLCLMILFGCLRESETKRSYNKKHKKTITSYTKKESKAHSTSECYCFPKSHGKRISEHISLNGEQQGRLVVYLFKNKNNQITTYVPNKQKQMLLPDLTLDVDDKLMLINKENIIELYNTYSNVTTSSINVNGPAWQKVPGGSSSPDIYFSPYQSLDSKTLKALIAKIDKYNPFNLNNAPKPDKDLHLQFNDKYPSINDLPLPGDLAVSPSPSRTNGSTETSMKYPNVNDLVLPGELTVHPIPPEIINALNTSKIVQDTQKKTPNVKPNTPEHLTIPHLFPPKVNEVPKNIAIQNKPTQPQQHTEKNKITENPALHPSHFIVEDGNENDYDLLSNLQYQYKPINLYQPPVPHHQIVQDGKYMYVLDDINGKYIPYFENSDIALDHHVIEEISSSDHKPASSPSLEFTLKIPQLEDVDNEILSPLNENSGQKIFFVLPGNELNDQTKFEQWFQKQVAFIGHQTPFLSQIINQSQLKVLILKALQNNQIYLSHSGDLIDSDGNTFDMTKLKLLPVLVGGNGDYNKVIPGKKIDSSSLKAILVTLAYPPRILCVIPLGKTLKERTNNTKSICHLNKYGKNPCCKGNQCHKFIVLDKDTLNILRKPLNMNIGNYGATKKLKSKTKGNSLLGSFITSRLGDVDSENKNEDDVITEDQQTSKDIDVPEEVEIKDIEDDDDLLGLRIIGGQAATSSGTPVTSKGRSGYVY